MIDIDFNSEEIQKFIELMGLGWYRVTKDGTFLECDSIARKIFHIPNRGD